MPAVHLKRAHKLGHAASPTGRVWRVTQHRVTRRVRPSARSTPLVLRPHAIQCEPWSTAKCSLTFTPQGGEPKSCEPNSTSFQMLAKFWRSPGLLSVHWSWLRPRSFGKIPKTLAGWATSREPSRALEILGWWLVNPMPMRQGSPLALPGLMPTPRWFPGLDSLKTKAEPSLTKIRLLHQWWARRLWLKFRPTDV